VLESLYMKLSYSAVEAPVVAREVLALLPVYSDKATIVGLSGPLGAGKTSLTQALALELGVVERVVSPTFVVAKWYTPGTGPFTSIVHMDAYRIESEDELVPLGFIEMIKKPATLVIIEWPEKLPKTLAEHPPMMFLLDHEGESRSIAGPLPYERSH
jgi:tRNA threonylcarbamoyladenosine biosynthesis protein TsaE